MKKDSAEDGEKLPLIQFDSLQDLYKLYLHAKDQPITTSPTLRESSITLPSQYSVHSETNNQSGSASSIDEGVEDETLEEIERRTEIQRKLQLEKEKKSNVPKKKQKFV